MVDIKPDSDGQTVIVTYDVPHTSCEELVGILTTAYDEFLSHQPGFVGAAIHVNEAKCRVASYSKWASREDFWAVLRSEEMQDINRRLGDMSKGFEPVLYDVARVYN
ncbi:MAG: antibiotic biosynthesis monooxygenase [Pseudomonadota bacterium]